MFPRVFKRVLETHSLDIKDFRRLSDSRERSLASAIQVYVPVVASSGLSRHSQLNFGACVLQGEN